MIFIIDNDDSFTFNLVQCVGALGAEPIVHKNDELSAEAVADLNPAGIIVASGAGRPEHAGNTVPLLKDVAGTVPVLGVGLGHLCAAAAFGAGFVQSGQPVHGKAETVEHDGEGLFAGLHLPFVATRYDSAVVSDVNLPSGLVVSARFAGGEIAALRHATMDVETVQFDPSSVLTVNGQHIIQNFIALTKTVRAA